MKYKLLALDLDGTSFERLGDVVEENIEPINQAIKKEVKVIFITGRPLFTKKNNLEKFDYKNSEAIFVAFNGAFIYDLKNNIVIEENSINNFLIRKAFDLLQEPKYKEIELWAYSVDKDICYISCPIDQSNFIKKETIFFDSQLIVYNTNLNIKNCYKFLAMNPNEEYIKELKNLGLEVAWAPGLTAAEVNKKNINKKYALELLAKKFNIQAENILAMGDGQNDIPMLEYAGLSIAPANAEKNVKEKVKEVSNFTNIQGAVAKAIQKYILGE